MARKVSPKLKTLPDLIKPSVRIPKPKIPGINKPLGGGTGESNPPITPTNSQRGAKQRVSLDVPGVRLR